MKELMPSTNYTIYIRSFLILKSSENPLIGEPSNYVSIKTKDKCNYHYFEMSVEIGTSNINAGNNTKFMLNKDHFHTD